MKKPFIHGVSCRPPFIYGSYAFSAASLDARCRRARLATCHWGECRLDLLGPPGASPSCPLRPPLTNWASAASEGWRGRLLWNILGEVVGTAAAAAVIAGIVQLLLLRAPSVDPRPELLGVLQHQIAVPVGELLIFPRHGEQTLRYPLAVLLSLPTSLHAEGVSVQPRK